MRKFFVTLMASLLGCSAAFAFWPEATDASFEVGIGYRWDDFKFRPRSNSTDFVFGTNAPIQFREDFRLKNLQIWQIDVRGRYVTCDNVYLRGCADWGWIDSGHSHQNNGVDFFPDGSGEVNVTLRDAHRHVRGHVYDVNLGVGYWFKLCDDSVGIAPVVGYAWDGQRFDFKRRNNNDSSYGYNNYNDGSFYFSDSSSYDDFSGSGSGEKRHHKRFHTRWDGPFIGFDFDYKFGCDWNFFAAYEYHFAYYRARADRGLRPLFPDRFRQRSKRAYGNVGIIGIVYNFNDDYTVGLTGEYRYYCAHHGRERTVLHERDVSDLEFKETFSSPLKRVDWSSGLVKIDVGIVF